ncbi:ABC transporter ATP-binding protein [Yinghuangia sp. YIM S10712]|uniref:ABC transporter ATP-binding protein n=1 Tax=Yinghuangia sp. YIM S10712 TaxID=3436930 RepID=UPI003F53CCA7
MNDTAIHAAELRKEFTVKRKVGRVRRTSHAVAAVDGVDLTIRHGETVGYIGPNGAGKSTTLKMMTGVLAPSGGHLSVCGLEPVPRRKQLARRIGVVFGQRSQLWWDLPLRESFRLLRHVYAVPERDHTGRLDTCRTLLDLDPFLDTPVRQLSLGQRMRGEITAALLHGPEVLFLDEPTIGLDVVSKHALRAFLADLRDGGDVTIVLTTHDLADIERLCPRLVVVDHGHIVHDGTLAELHERYGSRRRVVVDLDTPYDDLPRVPGVKVERVENEGHRVVFALDGVPAGGLIADVARLGVIRDIAVQEPDIEEVVARMYAGAP